MELLEEKTLQVSRGFTYTYYASAAKHNLPALLMIHGFPDSPEEFSDVVRDYLLPNGYGVIAVDCLGYGGTSKPLDREAYNYQLLAQDLEEIINKESVDQVISTGHDWGSPIAQRFYNFYPNRVCGLVLLNAAYIAPSTQPFDLDKVIELNTKRFGHGTHWYWKLFTAPNAAQILDAHLESQWTLLHAEPESWLETLTVKDGVRNFILQDKKLPVLPYATEQRRLRWLERFKSGGFDAPLSYYRAVTFGTQDKALAAILPENYVVKVPHLFWGGKRDYVCPPELCDYSFKAGLLPDCTKVVVDSGHWAHLDRPADFGDTLLGWLKKKFPRPRL